MQQEINTVKENIRRVEAEVKETNDMLRSIFQENQFRED